MRAAGRTAIGEREDGIGAERDAQFIQQRNHLPDSLLADGLKLRDVGEQLRVVGVEAITQDVDFIVVCDNYWLGDIVPCVTYGLRGVCYYFIEIECAHYDLHSGVYGGCVAEAMADLIFILNSLRDYRGKINIPNFYDDMDILTKEEIE